MKNNLELTIISLILIAIVGCGFSALNDLGKTNTKQNLEKIIKGLN